MSLPPAKLTTVFFANDTCAVCGHEQSPGVDPVPSWYTRQSIALELPPQVICDGCVQDHAPSMFEELLADRRRFWDG